MTRIPWQLLAVLAIQAALSASMVRASTAFGSEVELEGFFSLLSVCFGERSVLKLPFSTQPITW